MITIDQEVNCLDCLNGKVYICSNSMQDAIDCKCNGKPDRYTVLLHAFDTFEGACEYMTQIINVGECKVLPLIKAWNGGVVTAKWMAKKTDKGIKFELFNN